MSVTNVYFVAEQPIQVFDDVCRDHEIVLSKRVLCRALAIQIVEELDSLATPTQLEELPIPSLLAFISSHKLLIDVYSLKLKLWSLLYQQRDAFHLPDSVFQKPEKESVDTDSLDDVLELSCFQDRFDEWMGQPIEVCVRLGESIEKCLATPKVDTIDCYLPDIPMLEDDDVPMGFQENPELASLVSDVLAGETRRKRSRFLTFFTKQQ